MISDAEFMTFGYRAFFEHFHGKIQIKMTSDAEFLTFEYGAFFDISMEKFDENDI